ncbi:MAG: sulfurtransferase [Bacteroidetes bacterium]|nr:sulfurtransferase [Bacteroidota bacterium]
MVNKKIIGTNELLEHVKNNSAKIIDIRSVDAYNGWRQMGEKRGGHIKGAKSLDYKWSKYIDWIEIVRSKQIFFEDKLVVYSYSKEKSEKIANLFIKVGYNDVSIYNNFLDEWIVNENLPIERLSKYRQLVSAEWVKKLISGDKPDEYNNDKFIVIQSHYRNREAYLSEHIPGAIDMDTLALEASETWNCRSPQDLKKALEQHGISYDTTVVMYGKFMFPDNADDFPGSAAGQIAAIRNATIMLYAGVKDVRILNGGFQSWKDAGFDVSNKDVNKKQINNFGIDIPAHPEIIVDILKAKEMIMDKDSELVSVRSWPEYIGEVSGYNYIEKKGRIPGAIFGNCGTDAYHMENYRNVDHTVREAQEVVAIWKENGIFSDKHIAFYCGTGWRGSEAFFNAWLMGWPRVSVFDGGWFEWSNNPKNPYETGLPK